MAETPDGVAVQKEAWAEGKLVIVATIAEGPQVGGAAMCITPRSDFRDMMKSLRKSRDFSPASIASMIRDVIVNGSDDKDLMNDLAILMAWAAVGRCNDALLKACGLFSIMLSVNRDASQPWDRRGFITERDARTAAPAEGTWGPRK